MEKEQKTTTTENETRVITNGRSVVITNTTRIDEYEKEAKEQHSIILAELKSRIPNSTLCIRGTEGKTFLVTGVMAKIEHNTIEKVICLSNFAETIAKEVINYLQWLKKLSAIGKDLKMYDNE